MSEQIDAWQVPRKSGAPIERERKFLLRELPAFPAPHPTLQIRQGYLTTGDPEERVRHVRSDGEEHFFHTVKHGEGETREEFEEEIDKSRFRQLWPQTRGHRIKKVRHIWQDGESKWEIDDYPTQSRVIAEIEYDTPTPPSPPAWLAPYIEKDVTGNRTYFNKTLAS